MRLSKALCYWLLLFSLAAGANSDSAEHGSSTAVTPVEDEPPLVEEKGTISVHEAPGEVLIPSKIWDIVFHGEQVKPRLIFVPIRLRLKQKNPEILSQELLTFQFPRGGGELDLSQFVRDKRGSFYVDFEFEHDKSPETSYVFFVSHSRKRKVENEIWGSGCRSFYQIGNYLKMVGKKGGLLVNTTRFRHLSVLGGSFVFVNITGKEVRLAQITFKDSKNSQFFCPQTDPKSPSAIEEPIHDPAEGV